MMDWFKWLSSSNLDPSLVDKYGILFMHNDLQEEDVPFFNHEFLQSMGITIAKHRLEILKLLIPPPTKEKSTMPAAPMSRVLVAAKKSFKKLILKTWAKQRDDQSNALAIIPLSDDDISAVDHHGSRLMRVRRMLKSRMMQQSKSAATTPDSYYYYNKLQSKVRTNGGSPRRRSFSSSPFRKDCLLLEDRMNDDDNDDDDFNDGYLSTEVEETKWDSIFLNLKPT